MCRLFGFRSVLQSQVHRSLVHADNALAVQSRRHADGWGVAYYVDGHPHVIKSIVAAIEDQIFKRISGVVHSETVVAHLRKATVGDINILNSHPFQFGAWVFAHNGEVYNFAAHRERLQAEVAPHLRAFILGDTDSETIFYLFLTTLSQLAEVHDPTVPFHTVAAALVETVQRIREIVDGDAPEQKSKLTFIATNGRTMVGLRSRMPLLYSTYKSRCRDRGFCPFLSEECEAPTRSGLVKHLLIASETIQGNNIWIDVQDDGIVGVGPDMRLHLGTFDGGGLHLEDVAQRAAG